MGPRHMFRNRSPAMSAWGRKIASGDVSISSGADSRPPAGKSPGRVLKSPVGLARPPPGQKENNGASATMRAGQLHMRGHSAGGGERKAKAESKIKFFSALQDGGGPPPPKDAFAFKTLLTCAPPFIARGGAVRRRVSRGGRPIFNALHEGTIRVNGYIL